MIILINKNVLDELRLVKDGKYGSESPTGGWSGLVGEIVRRVSTMHFTLWNYTHKQECF